MFDEGDRAYYKLSEPQFSPKVINIDVNGRNEYYDEEVRMKIEALNDFFDNIEIEQGNCK